SVNVISPLMTTKNGLLKQPTWWPLLLFSKHMRGQTIGVNVQCGEYEGQTKPEWIRGTIETPWLDVSASINDEGIVSLVVVNIHETKSFATKLEGVSGKVDVFTVAGPSIDAVNTEEKEEVGIAESSWDGQGLYEFPQAQELAWHGIETNEFGTDEFLRWCEVVGTEPYLALNFGTGTLDEAMGWLEYCNSTADSHYANLRRQNGREEPYNVKYWALGNECWGPWQVEQMTKEDYAKKAWQWAKALKLLDPNVQLILCGMEGPTSWDAYVTKECINYTMHALGDNSASCLIDMHSIHIYTASPEHLKNATAPRSAERAIEITASLIDLARIENKIPNNIPRQKICFDEWNVWDPVRAPGWLGAEEKYTLSDALAVAVWLNVFIRQAKYIGMATIAQSVNVISPLMTTKNGLLKQPT
ncbi:hypothetical protein BN1723_016999, partial [Verticillium longisporum]